MNRGPLLRREELDEGGGHVASQGDPPDFIVPLRHIFLFHGRYHALCAFMPHFDGVRHSQRGFHFVEKTAARTCALGPAHRRKQRYRTFAIIRRGQCEIFKFEAQLRIGPQARLHTARFGGVYQARVRLELRIACDCAFHRIRKGD